MEAVKIIVFVSCFLICSIVEEKTARNATFSGQSSCGVGVNNIHKHSEEPVALVPIIFTAL